MKTKLIYIWDLLKTSFWFVPLLIILVAIALALGLVYLDSISTYEPSGFMRYIFSGSAESARSILSTIAGAMLTVAGTVFSITLVALTLATSNFGSRLLRNFMHDRLNQWVLGIYIATFVFSLLVLQATTTGPNYSFIPNLSVLFAIGLAVANIFLLILFIHHISVSIQANHVVFSTSKTLNQGLKTLFPKNDEEKSSRTLHPKEKENLRSKYPIHSSIAAHTSGYVQIIDYETMLMLTKKHDMVVNLSYRPGDFVVEKSTLIEVLAKEAYDDKTLNRLRNLIIVGHQRTPLQDAEFAIHQLVEIAARALSPGINDPYTAIICIDNLTSAMCYLTGARFPGNCRFDQDNVPRILENPLTFAGMMDAAFNQIRQYGNEMPAILIRLMESLVTINGFACNPLQKETLQRHSKLVLDTARSAHLQPGDMDDLKERYDRMEKREPNPKTLV